MDKIVILGNENTDIKIIEIKNVSSIDVVDGILYIYKYGKLEAAFGFGEWVGIY